MSLARGTLPALVSNLTSSAINKFDRKSKRSCQSKKMISLFILNEDMNDITITKLFRDPSVLVDGVSETVKDKMKNKKMDFLELC